MNTILIPVTDEKHLVRDFHSKAIINVNKNEMLESRTKIALANNAKRKNETMTNDIVELKKKIIEIVEIKNEVCELKTLILQLIQENNARAQI